MNAKSVGDPWPKVGRAHQHWQCNISVTSAALGGTASRSSSLYILNTHISCPLHKTSASATTSPRPCLDAPHTLHVARVQAEQLLSLDAPYTLCVARAQAEHMLSHTGTGANRKLEAARSASTWTLPAAGLVQVGALGRRLHHVGGRSG